MTDVRCRAITARVDEWYGFLSVYHEGVLGWFGGAQKITGTAADEFVVAQRLKLIRRCMNRIFDGQETFLANWTYLRGVKREMVT